MNNAGWAYGNNEYSEFLGLENTGFGKWVDRTFSKKKAEQQQGTAIQNIAGASTVFSTGIVDTAPPVDVTAYPNVSDQVQMDDVLAELRNAGQSFTFKTQDNPKTVVVQPNTNVANVPKPQANTEKTALQSVGKVAGYGVLIAIVIGGSVYLYKKYSKK